MTLSLKTSGDFNGLCEVSFVWDLNNVSPATLEVLCENRCDIFNLCWAVQNSIIIS